MEQIIKIWNLCLLQERLRSEESPQSVKNRVTTFWTANVVPKIKQGKNILIVAPGAVLKELVQFIESK